MNRNLLSIAFCVLGCLGLSLPTYAQMTDVGQPVGWFIKPRLDAPTVYTTPNVDVEEQMRIDELNQTNKVGMYRFGVEHAASLNLANSGTWTTLESGDRIWRLGIHCPNALTVSMIFDDFMMPEGAHIHVYSADQEDFIGAYTAANNSEARMLGVPPIAGEFAIIEYFEPKAVNGQGALQVGTIVHGYRPVLGLVEDALKNLNSSGDCNIDVNCPLGNGWQDQINSVALMMDGGGFCTGALINNTSNDGTPYFLTADHCMGGSPAGWVFRFNWDSPTTSCATTAPSSDPGAPYNDINGAVTRAQNGGSDVALLELNSAPASGVYFAGWDRTGATPSQTTGIHHPRGDVKKICRDDDNASSITWSGASVWEIANWDEGVTEPGSSGSPLFDQNQRIIGQLYGGSAACSGTTDNGLDDNYGRFSVSWDNGSSSSTRLRDWLDPSGTGISVLDGYDPNASTASNDAGVNGISGIDDSYCNTNTVTPMITLRNYGVNTLNEVDIYYNLNGGANSIYTWTGTLASQGTTTITLPTLTINTNGLQTFTAYTVDPNNTTDPNTSNDVSTRTFNVVLNGADVGFDLQLDAYGTEITWDIEDANGTVVASGGPYSDNFFNFDSDVRTLCLGTGCYTFNIYDSFGDGFTNSNGNYTITDGDGNVLVSMSDPDFGNGTSETFCVVATSIHEIAGLEQFDVMPNPTNGQAWINLGFATTQDATITVFSATGQALEQYNIGQVTNHQQDLDLSNYSAGMYFIQVQSNDGIATRKLIKQ